MKQITAKAKRDRVVIELPLDLLVFAQGNRGDPIHITDPKKMAEYIAKNILDFGEDEQGSAWEHFLDALFDDAIESAEDWLQGWWEEEEAAEQCVERTGLLVRLSEWFGSIASRTR